MTVVKDPSINVFDPFTMDYQHVYHMSLEDFNSVLSPIWNAKFPDKEFKEVVLGDKFDSLEFDSLDVLDLVLAIEDFSGKKVDVDMFFQNLTIEECISRINT